MKKLLLLLLTSITIYSYGQGQVKKAPEIKEGDGPHTQLIIRGVMLVDGTGAPPIGPVDIIVKQNKIKSPTSKQ